MLDNYGNRTYADGTAGALYGPTAHKKRPPYQAHPEKQPVSLQDHDHPVRFRNVWVRELAPRR